MYEKILIRTKGASMNQVGCNLISIFEGEKIQILHYPLNPSSDDLGT